MSYSVYANCLYLYVAKNNKLEISFSQLFSLTSPNLFSVDKSACEAFRIFRINAENLVNTDLFVVW